MQKEDGVNTALKNANSKGKKKASGLNAIIAEREFIEHLKISRDLKVKNSFAPLVAIVHGRTKTDVAEKMPLIR